MPDLQQTDGFNGCIMLIYIPCQRVQTTLDNHMAKKVFPKPMSSRLKYYKDGGPEQGYCMVLLIALAVRRGVRRLAKYEFSFDR
jgi:hypothetical protein